MKVLHVTPSMSPEWGGPGLVVSELTAALAAFDVDCEIVTTVGYRVGNHTGEATAAPMHTFDVGPISRIWTAYSRKAYRFLRTAVREYDLVHIHELWHHAGYAAAQSARRSGIPYVVTPHGALNEWNMAQKKLRKRAYMAAVQGKILRSARAMHAISPAEVKRFTQLGYASSITLAPNGTNLAQFDELPSRSESLKLFPQLVGRRPILFLGRLTAQKGLNILAHSFVKVAQLIPDSVLLVVGPAEDDTRSQIEQILSVAGVLDRTIFTGLLSGREKLAAMSCAEVFVLSSLSEGFSVAILEAMAARIPVIISDRCNFPEAGENGAAIVVSPDHDQVAESLLTLLADDRLRRRMAERGRSLVTERYTWDATASTVAKMYRSAVQGDETPFPNRTAGRQSVREG